METILVLNSGSSSLKVGLFREAEATIQLLLSGEANGIGRPSGSLQLRGTDEKILLSEEHVIDSQEGALQRLAQAIGANTDAPITAVGHRVVHGGPKLRTHVVINPEVMHDLEEATHFAPLHIPEALRLIRKAQDLFPEVTQVACFDTTFHQTMPEVATRFPIPSRYHEAGIQRYGFHGLSCHSVIRRIPHPLPEKIVIAHLGGGSSVTAVLNGESRDTTMGLSPTGGVPMSLRTGDLDPAILLYMMRTEGLSAAEIETLINHESGLFGLSDGESDMQALLKRNDAASALAVDVFVNGIRKAIAGQAATLGGIDLLAFTGGIGQHAEVIRERIVAGLAFLGISRVISVAAEEELEIALEVAKLTRIS